jgi:hypothetical protein
MRDIQEMVESMQKRMRGSVKVGDETATLPPKDSPIGYACPVCGEVYKTMEEAKKCRDQPFDDDGLKIGDIVVVPGAHNYYHLRVDYPWLAFEIPPDPDSGCHFDHDGYRIPFFVVTAIHTDREKHRCVVTLATILGGIIYEGWNPANGDGHYEVFKLDGSPRNRENHSVYWVDRMGDLLEKCVIPEQVKKEAACLASLGISTRNLL